MSHGPGDETVFVAIAAYREPELHLTIDDCLARATAPERLRFGICLQYDDEGGPETAEGCIDDLLADDRFRVLKFHHEQSQGGCWARHLAQGLYDGEDYTLQVDSHTRFAPGWDAELLEQMASFPSAKPLITGFPPLYHRHRGKDRIPKFPEGGVVPTTLVRCFSSEGWVDHPTVAIAENTKVPRRTRVLSGAFVFTLGQWNDEVRQDPDHLYTGEEFALTLRSFTWGYDLFNPRRVVVWHRNHPEPNAKYIYDRPQGLVRLRHDRAVQRLQILLAGDPEGVLGDFGLGPHRTLEEYRRFSGLDCVNWTVHPDAVAGVPPDPLTLPEG